MNDIVWFGKAGVAHAAPHAGQHHGAWYWAFRRRLWRASRWWRRIAMCICVLAALSSPSMAAVSLDRSRLIVSEQDREASVHVLNEGRSPVLIQAWVDGGDMTHSIAQLRVPFVVDPPVLRLEPGQSRQLRILMTPASAQLAADQESLFWFNILEVPPKRDAAVNHLQISFQTRLKVFYRPKAIAQAQVVPTDALTFLMTQGASGGLALRVRNRSGRHQTLDALSVLVSDDLEIALPTSMLQPWQELELPLTLPRASANQTKPWRVRFTVIDDFGMARAAQKDLTPD